MLFLSPGCTHAAWAHDDARAERFVRAVEAARQITISYIPSRVFSRPVDANDIARHWDVQTTVRCSSSCGGTAATQLVAFLRQSVPVTNACPEDYRFLIEVKDAQGQVVATGYGDSSWRCVQTSDGAFVLNQSMRDFLQSSWPPRGI
jgi:hypothetical protein